MAIFGINGIKFSDQITRLSLYFQRISSTGGFSVPVYLSNTASDLSGYKKLTTSIDVSETEVSITANNGTTLGQSYVAELPIGVSQISAGSWAFNYYRKVSSTALESFLGIDFFMVNPSTLAETALFSLESTSIEDLTYTERSVSYSEQLFTVDPTHRIGCRLKFRTTRNVNTTGTYIVGDGRGLWFRTPLTPRHSQLRGLSWLDSGHTGTANTIAGFDANGASKEYKAIIQSESSASSGTINLGVNTITVLTTTLTNSHTITVTPTAPTEFINSQIAQLDFTTGSTTPSVTLTAPSGVTFKWRHTEITSWKASKTYTIQFVWISSTRCDIYYLIS